MLVQNTTLEDLGVKAYWDAAGRNEIMPGDSFEVTPGGSIDVCFIRKPIQEEDGKWYVNDIYVYEPISGFISGIYKKNRILSKSFLGGTGNAGESLRGRIEEFAFWGRALDDAEIVNYQTNQNEMIGSGVGYKYQDEQEAQDDLLYQFYKTNDIVQVTKNFDGGTGTLLKNGYFTVESGKTTNSIEIIDNDAYMTIENFKSEKDFTINIRFFIEEMKDFVLFDNHDILRISFDESSLSFIIEFIPYIGNIFKWSVELTDARIHHWYDIAIKYSYGNSKLFIDGDIIESESPQMTIGGVEKISLSTKNISSISQTKMIIENQVIPAPYNEEGYMEKVYIRSGQNDVGTEKMLNKLKNSPQVFTFDSPSDNAISLIHDRDDGGCASFGIIAATYSIIDEVSDKRKIDFKSGDNIVYDYYYNMSRVVYYSSIEENIDDIGFKITQGIYAYKTGGGGYVARKWNRPVVWNRFIGNDMLRVTFSFKNEITDSEKLYPMLTLFPGARLKVVKRELLPHEIEYKEFFKDNGWGYYKNDGNKPGFKNVSGKTLIVKLPNSSKFAYVYNNYICYTQNGIIYTTTEYYYGNSNGRWIQPNNSAEVDFIFEEYQGE